MAFLREEGGQFARGTHAWGSVIEEVVATKFSPRFSVHHLQGGKTTVDFPSYECTVVAYVTYSGM